jgi:hypothetical protein
MPKPFLGCFALLCVFLPLHAQEKAPATKHVPSVPQKVEQKPADNSSVQILNSVTPQPQNEEKSKGYWAQFFAPENLPNIFLFAVGVAGVIVAVRTLKTIARQTKATEDSVKVIERQTKATEDSVKVAEKTMLLQFRPKVAIRAVTVTGISATNIANNRSVTLVVINEGGSNAHIVHSAISVTVLDANTDILNAKGISLGELTLVPGQGKAAGIPIGDELAHVMQEEIAHASTGPWPGHKTVALIGIIRYRDELGLTRMKSLNRGFNPTTVNFTIAQIEDAEYGT